MTTFNLFDENDEQAQRIQEKLASFDWEDATMSDMEDLFEDRDPFEFL